MLFAESLRVGYVVKRYPCFSETFIVREILANEKAGLDIEIFSLRPTKDGQFQDLIARVRAPVNYLFLSSDGSGSEGLSVSNFWRRLRAIGDERPEIWGDLEAARDEEPRDVYLALTLAAEVRQKNIGHLHASFAHEPCTVTRLAARFAGVSYSFTARAKDIFHENVRPDDLRRKFRDAVGVVTISDYHLDYLRQAFGPLATHVQRIYNGLDLEEYPYASPGDRPPMILAVGRLVEKKGFADLIDACALLARRPGREFRCRIVGTGALEVPCGHKSIAWACKTGWN